MKYENIVQGIFLERPNRFIARVQIDDHIEQVHVKNTGRCREILQPGTKVYLEKSANPLRKTGWSLIAAAKGAHLINIDSQAPNKVVQEALTESRLTLQGQSWHLAPHRDAASPILDQEPAVPLRLSPLDLLRPEATYGSSRFDFYYETSTSRGYIEVKGVTLEDSEIMRFPDAPTLRGARHMEELQTATLAGYHCFVFFVIQMSGGTYFTPNDRMDVHFGQALREAAAAGVGVQAFNCQVQPESLTLDQPLPCQL